MPSAAAEHLAWAECRGPVARTPGPVLIIPDRDDHGGPFRDRDDEDEDQSGEEPSEISEDEPSPEGDAPSPSDADTAWRGDPVS